MTLQVVLTSDNHLDPVAAHYGAMRWERKKDHLRCFEEVVEYVQKNRPDLFLIAGDVFDSTRPGNWVRARLMQHFRGLHEVGVKVFLVSGHHDTPKSVEEGVSPLAVYGNSGNAVFYPNPLDPTPFSFEVKGQAIHITGISYNPFLGPGGDPLAQIVLQPRAGVNILLTHYPIEGFPGYAADEPTIVQSSLPRGFTLVAVGHLHRYQRKTVKGAEIIYPGSTERASFAEEGEEKGFVWAEITQDGVVSADFVETSARPFRTLQVDFPTEGDPIRFLQERAAGLTNRDLVLRMKIGGRVSVDRLAGYRRPPLLAYAEGRFFHFQVEEEFEIERLEPVAALPRTTPLAELRRYFEKVRLVADEEERGLLDEALRLSETRLQEAGAW